MPKLIATIGGDVRPWERSVKQAESIGLSMANRLQSSMKGKLIGLFGVAAIEEFARNTIETISHIKEMSEQMGTGTKEVQEFEAAAKRAGLTIEDFAASIEHFGEVRRAAIESDPRKRKLFEAAGFGEQLNDSKISDLKLAEMVTRGVNPKDATDRADFREWFGPKRGGKMAAIFHEHEQLQGKVPLYSEKQIEDVHAIKTASSEFVRDTRIATVHIAEDFAQAAKHWLGRILPAGNGFENEPLPSTPKSETAQEMGKRTLGGLIKGAIGSVLSAAKLPTAKGGPLAQPFEEKTLAESYNRIFEIQQEMAFKKMNPGEQERYLKSKIHEQEVAANAYEGSKEASDVVEFAKHNLKAQELRSQLQDLIMGQKNTTQFDSLSKIGGLNPFSDVGNVAISIERQQLNELKTMNRKLTRVPSPHGEGN